MSVILFVSLFAFAFGLQKTVIISSMQITTSNSIPFDSPDIEFKCVYGTAGGQTGNPLELIQVADKNLFYAIEKEYFTWNNETAGNKISCTVTNKGLISDTDFGTSENILFSDITPQGKMFSTTYSNFFLRCGNCKQAQGTDEVVKKVGVGQVRVSTTSEDTPVQTPEFYVECKMANDATTYTLWIKSVKKANTDYTLMSSIFQFNWSNKSADLTVATCGIFESDKTGTDGLGTVIIQWEDVNATGTKYNMPLDPKTYITFVDCNEAACDEGNTLSIMTSIVLAFVGFALII